MKRKKRRHKRTKRLGKKLKKLSKSLSTRSKVKLSLFILIPILFISNFIWHSLNHPSQILSLFLSFPKSPSELWNSYKDDFKDSATHRMSSEQLAALALVESSGDPFATPPWTFTWSLNPFSLYRPASSAVGLMQLTKGTSLLASRYCISDGEVIDEGEDSFFWRCWQNYFSSRLSASHSIELTAAYLTAQIDDLLQKDNISKRAQLRLASTIHLCGKAYARKLIKNQFKLSKQWRCGTHSLYLYTKRVESYEKIFERLAVRF